MVNDHTDEILSNTSSQMLSAAVQEFSLCSNDPLRVLVITVSITSYWHLAYAISPCDTRLHFLFFSCPYYIWLCEGESPCPWMTWQHNASMACWGGGCNPTGEGAAALIFRVLWVTTASYWHLLFPCPVCAQDLPSLSSLPHIRTVSAGWLSLWLKCYAKKHSRAFWCSSRKSSACGAAPLCFWVMGCCTLPLTSTTDIPFLSTKTSLIYLSLSILKLAVHCLQ